MAACCAAGEVDVASDETTPHNDCPLQTYVKAKEDSNYDRRDAIKNVILAIPATGFAGVIILIASRRS